MLVWRADAEDTDGTEKDRSGELQTKEVDRKITGGAVHHHAWYKTPVVEGFDVLALGELVAAPAHDVGDHGRRQGGRRLLLEQLEIDGKFRDNTLKATEVDLVLVFAEVSQATVLNPYSTRVRLRNEESIGRGRVPRRPHLTNRKPRKTTPQQSPTQTQPGETTHPDQSQDISNLFRILCAPFLAGAGGCLTLPCHWLMRYPILVSSR